MKLAVIYVHYRTPDLLAVSIEAMRRSLDHWQQGTPGAGSSTVRQWQIVVVDNGDSGAQLDYLGGIDGLELIRSQENRGYAGGINLGLDHTPADRYLVLNPDVTVAEPCVAELMTALDGEAEVAGPRCFWDREQRLIMPPSDERSRSAELLAVLARHSRFFEGRWRARWRSHARRHWCAERPIASESLTGAILAFSAAALRTVGRFDEGYALYFEETDWLRRARLRGVPSFYVPTAHAVHSYAQSTEKEPQAERWFLESGRRFRQRHYGRAFNRLLERLAAKEAELPVEQAVELRSMPESGLDLADDSCWVEVSPSPTGVPAVAERLQPGAVSDSWQLPQELARRLSGSSLSIATSDQAGREILRIRVRV
jgi:GT2 family glycosyltransferase